MSETELRALSKKHYRDHFQKIVIKSIKLRGSQFSVLCLIAFRKHSTERDITDRYGSKYRYVGHAPLSHEKCAVTKVNLVP